MKRIMFNDKYGLTKAVLEGRKTMTRRIVNVPEYWHGMWVWGFAFDEQSHSLRLYDADEGPMEDPKTGECAYISPKYKVGEVVAVAQSYKSIHEEMMEGDYGNSIYDNFRGTIVVDTVGWNNKMFVRADLMPYKIRITDVKVERLQDISDEDCMKEGIQEFDTPIGRYCAASSVYVGRDGRLKIVKGMMSIAKLSKTPSEAFALLIDKVSGKGTWESNPYVFAYEFELVKEGGTE